MGKCISKTEKLKQNKLSINDFIVKEAIGKGGFGKVFIVERNG